MQRTNRADFWEALETEYGNGNRKLSVFFNKSPDTFENWEDYCNFTLRRVWPATREAMRVMGCDAVDTDGRAQLSESFHLTIEALQGDFSAILTEDKSSWKKFRKGQIRLGRSFMRKKRCHVNPYSAAYQFVCYCDEK